MELHERLRKQGPSGVYAEEDPFAAVLLRWGMAHPTAEHVASHPGTLLVPWRTRQGGRRASPAPR